MKMTIRLVNPLTEIPSAHTVRCDCEAYADIGRGTRLVDDLCWEVR
jgi:hypothetical protein